VTAVGSSLLIAGAYLFGAIPWGVVVGKVLANTDLREHGSRSTGATNAYRVIGAKLSLAVLVLDFLKGLAPVALARTLGANEWIVAATAIAAVIGHCWSIFIGFSGGKGMATGGGAIVALSPWALLILPIMIAIVVLTRYVSLASLIGTALAAAAFTIAAVNDDLPMAYAVAAVVVAAVIFYRHRSNIERLRTGTERKFATRPSPASADQALP
jgi:glycerol-3-phosphate acyltransferase PlsY